MRIARLVGCAALAVMVIVVTRDASATVDSVLRPTTARAVVERSELRTRELAHAAPPVAAAAETSATPVRRAAEDDDFLVFLPVIVKDVPPPTPTPTAVPAGWQILLQDNLDQSFPGNTWNDFNGWGSPDYFWGQRDCRAYSGRESAWAVGGGLKGSQTPCGAHYGDWSYSWMVHGPINLEGATAAELRFKMWLNTERGFDTLCRLASLDRVHYYGRCAGGNTLRWVDQTLDLSNVPELGNLLGQRQVWVGLAFSSDGNINLPDGAYVDDVIIRKCNSLYCPLSPSTAPASDAMWDDAPRMLIASAEPPSPDWQEKH